MTKFHLFGFVCVWMSLSVYAEPAPPPVAPIRAVEHEGWEQVFRIQNAHAEAVFVPAIGRLVSFAPLGGESLLRMEPSLVGKTPADDEPFFNIGGDWLWPVAQARWAALNPSGQDWPPPAVLGDSTPWDGTAWTDAVGTSFVQFTRSFGDPLYLEATRQFSLSTTGTVLLVRQQLKRTQPSEIPVVLWNISQIAKAEHIVLPTAKTSKFKKGLKVLMGEMPPKTHLTHCDDAAVYTVAPGAETKLGSDAAQSWIAATRGPQGILETVTNTATGDFPDGGCITEVYSNQGLGYSEIETLSPEVALASGAVLENILRIELFTLETPLSACPLAHAIFNIQ